jgi:DNA-binding CsgD family transcriptional regulator
MLGTLIAGPTTAEGNDAAAELLRLGRPASARALPELKSTLLLVADPDPILLQTLSAALLDWGVGRVIRVGTVDDLATVLVDGMVGDLALVGLGFGPPAIRFIAALRAAGWPRVITLAPTIDPGPLLDAVQAGATGVLRCPPGTPVPLPDPDPVPELSAREIEILRWVADGRSNSWIGARLSLSPLTVKNHLARISRKFGYGAREQLVAGALRGGIID